MPVNNVNNNVQNNTNIANRQETTQENKSSLNVDDFLRIMAAEISNQNPFSGGESSGSNTDYISQLAQFTMLEEMSGIGERLDLLTIMGQQQYAFSLIGQEVVVRGQEVDIPGTVEKVKFQAGFAILVIDGEEYGMGQLVEVGNEQL